MAQGVLDKAVGQLGDAHDDGDLDDDLKHAGAARVAGVHKKQQRVVPQVDAVRARAQPQQRLGRKDATHLGAGQRDGRNQQRRGHRRQGQAAAIPKRVGTRDQARHQHQRSQRGVTRVRQVALALGRAKLREGHGRLDVDRPAKGQVGAGKKREGARIGAVVDAAGVCAGNIKHKHRQGRGTRQCQAQLAHAAAAVALLVQEEHDQRPDQVELLLDGQRPEVQHRTWRDHRVKVGLLTEDVPPVGDPQKGREKVGL